MTKKGRLISAGIGLAIVLVLFWDWVPTVWLHSYYCDTYGGLTVAKTPDQWNSENPGVARTLVRQAPPLQERRGSKFSSQLNQRFRWEIERTERLFGVVQLEDRIVDSQTGTVLVKLVDFSTGQSNHGGGFRDLKFWMYRPFCEAEGKRERAKSFSEIKTKYEYLGVR